MNTKFDKVIEDLGWRIDVYEDGVELRKASPAGEDFSTSASLDNLVEDVRSTADDFDVEDHVYMLLDAKRSGLSGVPDIRTLIEDAEAIQEMLEELADALESADEGR